MEFVTHLIVALLSGYLAFTTALADRIEQLLPIDPIETTPATATSDFTSLPTAYESIPKVLIDNAAYQGAAAITAIDTGTANTSATPLEALVNIFCRYEHNSRIQAITGTGYIIGSNGVILTNAHIAQFMLLSGVRGQTACIARTGNPAMPTYQVELLYISPAWIIENAKLISQAHPAGTGERDYALLYITGGINSVAVPATIPALAINTDALPVTTINTLVTAAGYPAESAFMIDGAEAALEPKLATTTITELMTFGSNRADVMTLAGSVIGEQGVSGGPVIDANGQAIGIISTRGDDTVFGQGSLRAITLSYIDRTITEETGFSLTRNLGGNLPFRAKLFRDTMVPIMKLMLEQELAR